MKTTLLLISVLFLVGCGKGEGPTLADIDEKPYIMPTVKSVAGEYVPIGASHNNNRIVFLENGNIESYRNGKKDEGEHKWKISKEGELHQIRSFGGIQVFRINKDGSIAVIADINKDGKREDYPKEIQAGFTFKKIK